MRFFASLTQTLTVLVRQVATDHEREVFSSMVLSAIGQHAARLAPVDITGFLAMAGHAYDRSLMVVGRAVNGWTEAISLNLLGTPAEAERYAMVVQESVNGNGDCPMRWVTARWGARKGYNTRRSAFWRCIRDVVQRLCIADVGRTDWPSHLVWSNLYKVSPASGGNPNNALCNIQLPGCVELFNLELRTYRPRRILFLTGADWAAPFLPAGILQESAGLRHVKQFGLISAGEGHDVRYVVAVHPQGKPESEWVHEVVTAFNR